MISHVDWVERRFDFNFPVGLYPELFERLRGTPARLAGHLGPLSPAPPTRRDGPDCSMHEHAGHLWSLEELARVRLDEYAAGAATLHAADMPNRKTWVG
jgi:hypothetical protein